MMTVPSRREWPGETLARVPYWVYQDEGNYRDELRRIFEGPVWNYVALEADLPRPGDYRTTFVGEMPVIVVRGETGEIHAFENRCAHRGALIALDDSGSTGKRFQCVYHAWSYDLCGELVSVAFEKGVNGRGGMPESFRKSEHGPRRLRTATLGGLVFASLSAAAPPLEDYLGEAVRARLLRVLGRPVEVLGRFVQALPNNWKLYVENVKDTYHASLLHTFFSTFHITRLTQGGGVLVSPDGAHHASSTIDRGDDRDSSAYRDQGIRSEKELSPQRPEPARHREGVRRRHPAADPHRVPEPRGAAGVQRLAVRQVLPKGPAAMELHWTYLGFADDSAEMRRRRLRQANLVGPAGYVSMEDGCVGRLRPAWCRGGGRHPVRREHGRRGRRVQDTRATEAAVRGFWKAYRGYMGY